MRLPQVHPAEPMQDKESIGSRRASIENLMTMYNSQVLEKLRRKSGVAIVLE